MSLDHFKNQDLLHEVISLIESTKDALVSHANSTLTLLFWHIGKRLLTDKLQNKRAEYGK